MTHSFFRRLFLLAGLIFFSAHLPSSAEVLIIDEAGNKSGSAVQNQQETAEELDDDQNDGKAVIVSVEGRVRLMKNNSQEWVDARQGMEVQRGDKILTDASGTAEISYDNTFLNLVHIQENTLAEFRTIEPTDLYLQDGTVFSALDGLDPQSSYQVSTPSAVAAVRGTHFDVQYDKNSESFSAAAHESEEVGHPSVIYVTDPRSPAEGKGLEITQGQQLDLPKGSPIQREFLRAAAPERIQAGKKMRAKMFEQVKQRVPEMAQRREYGKQKVEEKRARFQNRQPGAAGGNNPKSLAPSAESRKEKQMRVGSQPGLREKDGENLTPEAINKQQPREQGRQQNSVNAPVPQKVRQERAQQNLNAGEPRRELRQLNSSENRPAMKQPEVRKNEARPQAQFLGKRNKQEKPNIRGNQFKRQPAKTKRD